MMLTVELEFGKKLIPELLGSLQSESLTSLEATHAESLVKLFKMHGCPELLVPTKFGGQGRRLVEVAPLFRLIGSLCPSLGIMMLMHYHTIGAFCFDDIPLPCSDDLLQKVVTDKWLIGSAFSESKVGVDVLESSVTCEQHDNNYVLNGHKKPCTMSHHADAFLVGVVNPEGNARGMALVERCFSIIKVEPFWSQSILCATDSERVVFENTQLASTNVMMPSGGGAHQIKQQFMVSQSEITISCLFQLLMPLCYLGVATRLCQLLIAEDEKNKEHYLNLSCEIEAASMAQYQLAQQLENGNFSGFLLGQAMSVSYNAVQRIECLITEASKYFNAMEGSEIDYMVRVSRCINFHPPSKEVRSKIINNYYC